MTTGNSPYYTDGVTDGAADAALKPPNRRGLDPEKAWSIMYRKGYLAGFPASGIDPYANQDHAEAS